MYLTGEFRRPCFEPLYNWPLRSKAWTRRTSLWAVRARAFFSAWCSTSVPLGLVIPPEVRVEHDNAGSGFDDEVTQVVVPFLMSQVSWAWTR